MFQATPFLRFLAIGLMVSVGASSLVATPEAVFATTDQATSQNKGVEAFLAGKFVEVGVRANGAFGSSGGAPTGFHPQQGSNVGFVAIRDMTQSSWTAAKSAGLVDGDFFLPGSPYEGWGIRVGSSRTNNNDSATGIAGTLGAVVNATGDSGNNTVTWTSNAAYNGIQISKTYSVPQSGQSLDVTVTLTNPGDFAISDIFYGRGVDPDDSQSSDPYTTTNTVVAQYSEATPYSLVRASFTRGSQILLFSEDPRGRVARESSGFNTTFDPQAVWDGTAPFIGTVGDSATRDAGMNLAFKIASLDAGASTTLTYSYLLTAAAAEAAVAAASPPAAPAVVPQSQSAELSWTSPPSDAAIVGYRVRYSSDNGSTWTVFGTDTVGDTDGSRALTVTGLTDGTTYLFQVAALTGDATLTGTQLLAATLGQWSQSSAQLIAGRPSAPTISSVTRGDASLVVEFTAPAHDGGSALSGYEYSINNGGQWLPVPLSPLSFTIGGLTNGTSYSVLVRAVNAQGTGLPSVAVLGTPATIPGAPTISSVTPGNAQIVIAFTSGGTGGSAITNYRYSTDGGATFRLMSPTRTASPLTITVDSANSQPLANGTTYPVVIQAINAVGSSLGSNSLSATPRTVPSAPTIELVSPGNRQLIIGFTPGFDGGSALTNYEYSTDGVNFIPLSPARTLSPITISLDSVDGIALLDNGTEYSVSLKAVSAAGVSIASNSLTGTPSPPPPVPGVPAPRPTVTEAPLVVVAPRLQAPLVPQVSTLTGPVLRGGVPPTPGPTPQATVNGAPLAVETRATSPTGLSLVAGALNLGLTLGNQTQGGVAPNTLGSPELSVVKGQQAGISGVGARPLSTVQLFLPLGGDNSIELARIPVDATGSFRGDAVFNVGPTQRPLPIGRQVLQIASVDPDGRQTIIDMPVNIAQPTPAPELNRLEGVIPTMRPGQSIATNAGEPEFVTVVPLPEQRQARVEGDGWTMAVDIPSSDGRVGETPEGGAVLELVRDETAVVSGSGFMPGTRADVWLFSEPTLLGTVDIDDNGEFNGQVNVDGNVVAAGEHTLQLQGVGEDGYVRAANLGVIVNDAAPELTTEDAAGFLWWLWLLVAVLVIVVAVFLYRLYRKGQEDA